MVVDQSIRVLKLLKFILLSHHVIICQIRPQWNKRKSEFIQTLRLHLPFCTEAKSHTEK